MRLICHRGGRGFGPDNTLQAMEEAVRVGVEGIEADVRMTVDGELVLHHDPEVGKLAIKKTPLARLREESPDLPLLREVMESLAGKTFFDMEIKEAPPRKVVDLLDEYGMLPNAVFTSFREETVDELKRARPGAKGGPVRWTLLEQNRLLHWMLEIGAEVLALHHRVLNEDNVAVLHALGLEIYAWTVNDEDDVLRMRSLGVDGLITDRYLEVDRLLRELGPSTSGT